MVEENSSPDLLGNNGKSQAEVKAGLKIDVDSVKKLDSELKVVKDTIKALRGEMDDLTTSAKAAAEAMGGSGGGAAKSKNGQPGFNNTSSKSAPTSGGNTGESTGGFLSRMGGGKIGGGLTGNLSKVTLAAGALGMAGGQITGAIDQRIDTNRAWAISADRLSMEMQMRSGQSQNQAWHSYRQPLQQYKLGRGGQNVMLQAQNQYGINAQQQAGSVEDIRAATGFSMGTSDVMAMMQSNLAPQNVNRQFMMLGGSNMYTPGGELRDYNDVLNERVQMFGLTDETLSKGAKRQGSVTRARMSMSGISTEEQDLLLSMGDQQRQFAKKGGKGTFDRANKDHLKLMGTDDQFATQAEETDRLREKREDDMYNTQQDNYSKLEKSNQKLIETMTNLERTMSGLIGARANTRPWQKIAGRALQIGGGIAMATGVGTAPGAVAFGIGTAMSGDGTEESSGGSGHASPSYRSSNKNDDDIFIPVGYGGQKKSLTDVKQRGDFKKMHPKMQQRMLSMFRENPKLGIGGGWRDSDVQKSMFLSRYKKTDDKSGVFWNGSYWKRHTGAPAAPPGRSMHEIGLAADLVGDLGWLQQNASRFGLKTFADVNDEPWHIQAVELPNSRRKYEEGGSSWGTDGGYDEDVVFTEKPGDGPEDRPAETLGDSGGGNSWGIDDFTGSSISSIIDALANGGGIGGGGHSSGPSRSGSSDRKGTSSSATGGQVAINGTGADLAAQAAYNAGFRGDDLATIVAIAGRESGWDPNAVNKNTSDRGMWQINWSAHQERAKKFGAKSDMDLLDINLNAKVAHAIFKDAGWHPWRASDTGHNGKGPGWDGNGDHLWHTEKFTAQANAAASSVSGDPVDRGMAYTQSPKRPTPTASTRGTVSANITNAPVINLSPVFNFTGTAETPHLRAMAKELGNMIEEEVRTLDMRTE